MNQPLVPMAWTVNSLGFLPTFFPNELEISFPGARARPLGCGFSVSSACLHRCLCARGGHPLADFLGPLIFSSMPGNRRLQGCFFGSTNIITWIWHRNYSIDWCKLWRYEKSIFVSSYELHKSIESVYFWRKKRRIPALCSIMETLTMQPMRNIKNRTPRCQIKILHHELRMASV